MATLLLFLAFVIAGARAEAPVDDVQGDTSVVEVENQEDVRALLHKLFPRKAPSQELVEWFDQLSTGTALKEQRQERFYSGLIETKDKLYRRRYELYRRLVRASNNETTTIFG